MQHDSSRRPNLGLGPHDDHHTKQLKRIEASVGRSERSVGLCQGALERIERILKVMATDQDVLDAIAAIDANVEADLAAEKTQILAAIAAAAQGPLDTVAQMQQQIDQLTAELAAGHDVSALLAAVQASAVATEDGIRALVEDAPVTP